MIPHAAPASFSRTFVPTPMGDVPSRRDSASPNLGDPWASTTPCPKARIRFPIRIMRIDRRSMRLSRHRRSGGCVYRGSSVRARHIPSSSRLLAVKRVRSAPPRPPRAIAGFSANPGTSSAARHHSSPQSARGGPRAKKSRMSPQIAGPTTRIQQGPRRGAGSPRAEGRLFSFGIPSGQASVLFKERLLGPDHGLQTPICVQAAFAPGPEKPPIEVAEPTPP